MIEQRDVVGRVGLPSVGGGDRRARLAGVALIHRDDAEIIGEFDRGIERALMPELDAGAHSARRKQQDWVAGTELLEVEGNITALENRHDWLSSMKTKQQWRAIAQPSPSSGRVVKNDAERVALAGRAAC